MHYLLLSCSSKKVPTEKPVRAVELYNGVFFSVYKKALKKTPSLSSRIRLIIVSAKYGLIKDTDEISLYDMKMTAKIAVQQQSCNTAKLQSLLETETVESLTIVMGKAYLQSINLSDITIPYQVINGKIGMMLHSLKEWLEAMSKE